MAAKTQPKIHAYTMEDGGMEPLYAQGQHLLVTPVPEPIYGHPYLVSWTTWRSGQPEHHLDLRLVVSIKQQLTLKPLNPRYGIILPVQVEAWYAVCEDRKGASEWVSPLPEGGMP